MSCGALLSCAGADKRLTQPPCRSSDRRIVYFHAVFPTAMESFTLSSKRSETQRDTKSPPNAMQASPWKLAQMQSPSERN